MARDCLTIITGLLRWGEAFQLRAVCRAMPQPRLLRHHQRDRLRKLVGALEVDEQRRTKGSLDPFDIVRPTGVKAIRLLNEIGKAPPLHP